jgi:intergrase/recombinase
MITQFLMTLIMAGTSPSAVVCELVVEDNLENAVVLFQEDEEKAEKKKKAAPYPAMKAYLKKLKEDKVSKEDKKKLLKALRAEIKKWKKEGLSAEEVNGKIEEFVKPKDEAETEESSENTEE